MPLDTWLLYAAATLLLSLTPGPSGLLALSHGALHGVGRAVFTVAGGVAGFALLIAASMSGLGALLASSGTAFVVVEFVVELTLAAGASRILPWLSRERVARRFARGTGALFVGAGVALVATNR